MTLTIQHIYHMKKIAMAILLAGISACNGSTKGTISKTNKNDSIMETKTNQDYSTTILVDQTPLEVFDAVNNVRGWWSEQIEGSTDKPDAEFNYHYKDVHLCKMKIVEFIPGQKVVWLVLDNYFNFVEDKTEWKGTKIIFEISEPEENGNGGKTQLRFTHQGLVPQYECYDICREAWGNYINNSLRSLITTGKGQPNPKEGEGYNARLAEKWKLE